MKKNKINYNNIIKLPSDEFDMAVNEMTKDELKYLCNYLLGYHHGCEEKLRDSSIGVCRECLEKAFCPSCINKFFELMQNKNILMIGNQ